MVTDIKEQFETLNQFKGTVVNCSGEMCSIFCSCLLNHSVIQNIYSWIKDKE